MKQARPRQVLLIMSKILLWIGAAYIALIILFLVINPPINIYQIQERIRLGALQKDWVAMAEIAPDMQRAVVAAEDANFCRHWGFDIDAIRNAVQSGGQFGASTISQQTVKNVFLWQGRSWPRKALEAILTPIVESIWPKRRILEVYLNVAEFGTGIFGVEAAAQRYFGISAAKLTSAQAARLAAILPAPQKRDPVNTTASLRKRSRAILSGIETIKSDGRDTCFQR